MLINGKHIRGMFVYSEDIPFTAGDFVIYGDSIYICIAKNPTNQENYTVSGKNPEEDSENYKLYLSENIATFEEYLDYIKDPLEKEDKSVGCDVLSKVLSYYLLGQNERGIIDQSVGYVGSSLEVSEQLKSILTESYNKSNVLEKILKEKEINNAVLRVSRELPEIASIFPKIPTEVLEESSEDDLKSVVLKQYTYKEDNETLVRIQELVDHVNAIQLFRYSKDDFSKISSWKRSFINENFRNELDYIKNYYNSLISNLETERKTLKNFFRSYYVNIAKSNTVNIQCEDENRLGYINTKNGNFNDPTLIDILVLDNKETFSITIDLSDSLGELSITNYKISGTDLVIQLTNISNTSIDINLQSINGVITNIVGRSFLK